MAQERSGFLSEGALYEAVARGNKDNYFFTPKMADAVNPFETRYLRRPGFVNELRRVVPLNAPDFGRVAEFEFDIAGESFLEATVLIDLPSWLPPVEATLNQTSGYSVLATSSGRAYGYSRGIAYFLFSSIQIFQDKVLLQEVTGDALWSSRLSQGSLNSAYLDQALTGMTDVSGSAILLSRNATPGRLRLTLPMLGGRSGVPSIAMRHQNFRLRLTLRPLEELLECSDTRLYPVAPWSEESFTVTRPDGTTYTVAPVPREQIARPSLSLETRHVYMDPESRAEMERKNHELPYITYYENPFTFAGLDYASTRKAPPSNPIYVRDLDGEHPARRMLWFFRTRDDIQRGRRWATSSYKNPYYQNFSFLIAGRDRESTFTPLIWNTLTHFAKEERDPGFEVSEMAWDLGAVAGRQAPAERVPEGAVNFGTAEKPVFSVQLRAPNAGQVWMTEVIDMTVLIESWALYTVEGGRGMFKYYN